MKQINTYYTIISHLHHQLLDQFEPMKIITASEYFEQVEGKKHNLKINKNLNTRVRK